MQRSPQYAGKPDMNNRISKEKLHQLYTFYISHLIWAYLEQTIILMPF